MSAGATFESQEEAARLEEEGRVLEQRIEQLRQRVEEGRRSVEDLARDAGAFPIKHGGDLLFLPKEAVSAVFRIDNVSVNVSINGRRGKERVVASMGIRVGVAAEEHLDKIKLKDELDLINSRPPSTGSFKIDADALGLNLSTDDEEMPDFTRRTSSSRIATEDDDSFYSPFVFINPRLPGVPKMNQIIIKLIPKIPTAVVPKNPIVPKFINSDPAWFTVLRGLQEVQGEQAWPMMNPDQQLIFESPPPRSDSGELVNAQIARHFAQSSLVSQINAGKTLLMVNDSEPHTPEEKRLQSRELVRIHHHLLTRREQLDALDIATKGEVDELRKEVQAMRGDLDRMLQLLSAIHREMVTRKAAGPQMPSPMASIAIDGDTGIAATGSSSSAKVITVS